MDSDQKKDQALRVADFKIDDLLSVPSDRLLAEVAEDFGDPAFLAAEFDAISSAVLSRHDHRVVRGTSAAGTAPRSSPSAWSFPWAAPAMLAEWLAAALRRRVVVGALATLLLVAILAPGIYPRLTDHAADRFATAAKDEPELKRAPAQTPSPLPQAARPAPPASAGPSAAVAPAPPPAPASAYGPAPAPAPRMAQRAEDRSASPPPAAAARRVAPQPMTAAAPPESAGGQATRQRQAAKSSVAEGKGFAVQLSAARSEAKAQSTYQVLRSKYAALKDREPMIRRKDQGKRGVFYTVQVGPFASQDDAQQLCDQLKGAGGTCFTTRN